MSKKTDQLEAELAELRRVLATAAGTPVAEARTSSSDTRQVDAYTLAGKDVLCLSDWLKASPAHDTFTISPVRNYGRVQVTFTKLTSHGGVSITIRELP